MWTIAWTGMCSWKHSMKFSKSKMWKTRALKSSTAVSSMLQCLHLLCMSPSCILQDLQNNKSCLLYLDATDSVVAKPHPSSQSVLYNALCIPCQSTMKTVVPVAGMLMSDQTTATILHWLTCIRRDYYKPFQKHFKPQKVETDLSWAMVHEVVQALNIISV